MTDKPFHYFEVAPASHAAPIAAAYWGFESRLQTSEPFEHHLWPDGCISLGGSIVNGRVTVTFVVGPTLRAHRTSVERDTDYFGIKFWPEAGAATLGLASNGLRDRIGLAGMFLGDVASSFSKALSVVAKDKAGFGSAMDAWIAEQLRARGEPRLDTTVRDAVRCVMETKGGITVAALARESGLSARQLHRRFVSAVGVTPKEFIRIRRVRSAIAELLDRGETWSRVAAELGYADQSHLVRDMSEVTGLTPSVLSQRIRLIEHTAVTP